MQNDIQDTNGPAWAQLCEYVEKVADEGIETFAPAKTLGAELFSHIHTLPKTISKLKNVKHLMLGNCNIRQLPAEIGEMESLRYLYTYMSYHLHWYPYEIVNCRNLKKSYVSTRALYGNFKTNTKFPSLKKSPIRYMSDVLCCSICKKEITYEQTQQLWITLRIATDDLPLLANLCSKECKNSLTKAHAKT